MHTRHHLWIIIAILSSLALAGCFAADTASEVQILADSESPSLGAESAPIEARSEEAEAEEAAPAFDLDSGAAGGGIASEPPSDFAASAAEEVDTFDEAAPLASGVAIAPAREVLALKAGEIDDNAQWDDYLLYRREFLEDGFYPVHDIDVSGRHIINVTTAQGLPVLGAHVQIFDRQKLISDTRTYATGQTLFFPNANRDAGNVDTFRVVVEKDGEVVEFDLNRNETNEWHVTMEDLNTRRRARLDVLFLIDATGSMSDEIEELQSNILSISDKINALPGSPDTRYGMVTYRDRDEEYVTRVFDFTPDVRDFQDDLDRVRAEGGGDNPESLNEALHDAVQRPEWRVEDTISLMFLVADAPPHLDYGNDYDYAHEVVQAAQRGIKIHPIASSGLDPQGEFIFRQIGQYTMGHFVFLTYADGPQDEYSRPDLAAGGEDYTVDALDDLVLRLITDELAAFNGQ